MQAWFFTLLLGIGLLLTGCSHPSQQTERSQTATTNRGSLVLALEAPESLDPILSTNYAESEIVLQLFDGLLRFDKNLNITPAIAQDWRIDNGGLRYRFQLRPDVKFHQGRLVTADDFVYSFTRLLDPRWKSPDAAHYLIIQGARDFQAGRTLQIAGLKAISSTLLEITLEEPFSPFLSLLALQAASVVPRESVEKAIWSSQPQGTGPFRLTRWEKGREIILSGNPEYYLGPPRLLSLKIKTIPALGATQNFEAFLRREVDFSFIPPEKVAWAKSNPAWQFLTSPVLRLVFLGFNLRNRVLQDVELRQWIGSLLDPPRLIGQLPDYLPIFSIIPISLLGSTPVKLVHPLKSDYKDKKLPASSKLPFKLCYAKPPTETRRTLMERLMNNLNRGGIPVTPTIVSSFGELQQKIRSGEADLFIVGEIMDFPDPYALLYRLFYSSSAGNLFNYRNPRIDQLLIAAQKTTEEKTRASLYAEIEHCILEEAIVIPLFTTNYTLILSRKIKGIELTPLGFQYLPLRTIWIQE